MNIRTQTERSRPLFRRHASARRSCGPSVFSRVSSRLPKPGVFLLMRGFLLGHARSSASVSFSTDCLPTTDASNHGNPCQSAGTENKGKRDETAVKAAAKTALVGSNGVNCTDAFGHKNPRKTWIFRGFELLRCKSASVQRLENCGARRAALRSYFLGSYALKSLILLTFLRMIFCGHP